MVEVGRWVRRLLDVTRGPLGEDHDLRSRRDVSRGLGHSRGRKVHLLVFCDRHAVKVMVRTGLVPQGRRGLWNDRKTSYEAVTDLVWYLPPGG